jgi:DNA replication licensing factor MCM4
MVLSVVLMNLTKCRILYLVLDQADEGQDRKLAQYLVGLYLEDAPAADTQDIMVSVV